LAGRRRITQLIPAVADRQPHGRARKLISAKHENSIFAGSLLPPSMTELQRLLDLPE
jgi:hypothetical protein